MKNFDLFDGETEITDAMKSSLQSKYQKAKLFYHYRKATDSKRCGNCANKISFDHHDKKYHKCKLIGVSNSEATDIRVGSVCDAHEYPSNYLELLKQGQEK